MRLSDAIATGRVLINEQRAGDLNGCAIGMGLLAEGKPTLYGEVNKLWPWLSEAEHHCAHCSLKSNCISHIPGSIVFRFFDVHVMTLRDQTLDQLIDWVRSIEPDENISVDIPVEEVEYASVT